MSGIPPHPAETNPLRLNRAIRDLFEGRSNTYGTFTMTENSDTTVVTQPNVGPDSVITLTPRTSAAATEFGAGTWYISAVAEGTFTVTHVNSATANRTFDYAFHG